MSPIELSDSCLDSKNKILIFSHLFPLPGTETGIDGAVCIVAKPGLEVGGIMPAAEHIWLASTLSWEAEKVTGNKSTTNMEELEVILGKAGKRPRCDWFPNELCPRYCWSLEVCHCDKNYGWERRINVGNVFENCFLGLDLIFLKENCIQIFASWPPHRTYRTPTSH